MGLFCIDSSKEKCIMTVFLYSKDSKYKVEYVEQSITIYINYLVTIRPLYSTKKHSIYRTVGRFNKTTPILNTAKVAT